MDEVDRGGIQAADASVTRAESERMRVVGSIIAGSVNSWGEVFSVSTRHVK